MLSSAIVLDRLRMGVLSWYPGVARVGAAMEFFSTAGLPLRRKMAYWSEVSSQTFAAMQIVPRDREGFEGRLSRELVGPLALAEVCSSAGSIHHTQMHVASASDPRYVLVTPIIGGFQVVHGRRRPEFEVQVGEFCLLDESCPYRLTHTQPTRTFCIVLGDRLLRDFIPEPARVGGVLMRPVEGSSRLLVAMLQHLSQELASGWGRGLTPELAYSLTGFIGAAYAESQAAPRPSAAETRRLRIQCYVDERLHDPLLRPATIARQFGISARYLRRLFESDHERLSSYIVRRRLENCARLLQEPAWRGRTISEIAFRNGFNNLTHFGYAFKKHFGVTAREYRARRIGDSVFKLPD